MFTLLMILAVLFLALIVLVKVTERFGQKGEQQPGKFSRFIVPLVALMIILQLARQMFWPDGF